MESGEVRAYEIAEPTAFIPFLYIARCFMQTGTNYIHFGNYDNTCFTEETSAMKAGEKKEDC